jgi:hypothetical protein
MTKQNRYIPNPNKISDIEERFVKKSSSSLENLSIEKDNYKGRMISMSDSFYKTLNDYLRRNPTEGNRSSFIVRVVADYIDKKL